MRAAHLGAMCRGGWLHTVATGECGSDRQRRRVRPYVLHHADLARGTGHFRVNLREGQALMRALRGRVSGLCQPSYVLDLPGGRGKVPVGPCYADAVEGDGWMVEDFSGGRHRY